MAAPEDQDVRHDDAQLEPDRYRGYSDDIRSDMEPEDVGYQEVTSTMHVPTKTGDEDGTAADRSRPLSAGSSNGPALDSDDVAVFAVKSTKPRYISPPPSHGGMLLSRSSKPEVLDATSGFSFAAAPKQTLDLTGTVRTISSNAGPPGNVEESAANSTLDKPATAGKYGREFVEAQLTVSS